MAATRRSEGGNQEQSTVADAILDRIVHQVIRIELYGEFWIIFWGAISSIFTVYVGEKPDRPEKGTWTENGASKRQWEACIEYGFINAGQGRKYSEQLENVEVGDIVIAFITQKGYVGVGKVIDKAKPINKFKFKGSCLNELDIDPKLLDGGFVHERAQATQLKYLTQNIFMNANNDDSECYIKVEWIVPVHRNEAFWIKGLFKTKIIYCNLSNQKETIMQIEKEFNVKFIYL